LRTFRDALEFHKALMEDMSLVVDRETNLLFSRAKSRPWQSTVRSPWGSDASIRRSSIVNKGPERFTVLISMIENALRKNIRKWSWRDRIKSISSCTRWLIGGLEGWD
jgi:hypothetical protein